MSVQLKQLVAAANELLNPSAFTDYCPNGLQVEGKTEVRQLVTGVTASQALIDRAIDEKADAILVHHGYFWKGEDPCITGMKKNRVAALLANNISLLAYHLPLDAHPQYGNNVQLARQLGIEITGTLEPVGNIGHLQTAMSAQALAQRVNDCLGRQALLITAGDHNIETIAWCTGAAQSFIEAAAQAGADAYLSGEVSEPTVHSARELGIHYIAAGHHATERYGVQAVGRYLAERFDLVHQFIDVDNPV